MPIYNKGRFKLSEIIQPQFGNNWPTAQVTTTSDVIEVASNLYFTNARVISAVLPYLTTSNVSEGSNLYYTNARVYAAITGNLATKANVVDLTTANVSELTNLYYTNARVYANVIALLPTLAGSGITIQANGQINSSATLTLASLSPFLTTSNVSEGSNLYYTNTRVISAVLPYLTTSNVSEGSNLYYTNARVYSNVIALLPTLAGSGIQIQANGQISASGGAVTFASISQYLTTSNVSEGTNLYYTNARVLSALTGNVTVGNIVSTTSVSNSYTTTGNVNAGNVISNGAFFGSGAGGSLSGANLLSATNIQANIWLGLYTANVIESSTALYYTNTRVNSNVIAFLPSLAGQYITIQANGQISSNLSTDATIVIAANGQIRSNTSSGGITSLAGFTTANLAEGGANLYFSNARAIAAFSGGSIFRPSIATFRGNAQLLNYALPITPANNNYVTVIINGVTQLSNAYTLSGNTLVLSGYPAANADIDVRILDVTQVLAKDFNSRLFYGNGSANVAAISNNFTDSSILVFENGVAQVPGVDYSASGGVLRFATPPRTGVTVEIRELPTLNGTQTYVGGQNIQVLANGQINSNITAGQNLTISANGQINATVQEQIHPFLLSLL